MSAERITVALGGRNVGVMSMARCPIQQGATAEPRLTPNGNPTSFFPPRRRSPNRDAWKHARYFRGPTWSCAQWAMSFVGRSVALAPDHQHRHDNLREGARVLAALVRNHEVHKPDAVDRILNVGIAFGIDEHTIREILFSEFAS